MKRRQDLTTPRQRRRVGIHYDPDAFGQFSEAIARFLGTGRYLVIQTVIVFVWVTVNVFNIAPFDEYPFQFFNLALAILVSLQGPLIVMSQNRQAEKDRAQSEADFRVNLKNEIAIERLQAELAALRADSLQRLDVIERHLHAERIRHEVPAKKSRSAS